MSFYLIFLLPFELLRLLVSVICIVWQVEDVKRTIESTQGADIYPAAQQMLIHQGKILKDGTTLEENKVAEKSFVVVMLSKVKADLLLIS